MLSYCRVFIYYKIKVLFSPTLSYIIISGLQKGAKIEEGSRIYFTQLTFMSTP